MDDWVLATYNIPSVTGEIGNESDFVEEWTVSSPEKAYDIISKNQPWLEHTYHKIGSQLKLTPSKYQLAKDQQVPPTADSFVGQKDQNLLQLVGKSYLI